MKLEILSFDDVFDFVPSVKTHPIRIASEYDNWDYYANLKESSNWVRDMKDSWYYFSDKWTKNHKEYSWVDINGEEFEEYLKNKQKKFPKMTKENLIDLIELKGHIYEREILFNYDLAIKIYSDFEKYKDEVEQVMVHCQLGINRSPAVGMAMNETYGWGIEGLKEKFPHYRRFVYDIMKEVGEDF